MPARTAEFVQFKGIPKIQLFLKSDGGYEIDYEFQSRFTPAERKAWQGIWYNVPVGPGGRAMGPDVLHLNAWRIAVKDQKAVLTYTNRIAEAVQETGAQWNIPRKTTDAIVDLLRKQVNLIPGGTPENYAIEISAREEKSGKTIPPRTGGRQLCGRCGKYTSK